MIVNPDTEELILKEGDTETVFSLKEINTTLRERYGDRVNNSLDANILTFILTSGTKTVKAIFQNYSIKNPKFSGESNWEYAGISGYALVK
jgi:hypothetical protein